MRNLTNDDVRLLGRLVGKEEALRLIDEELSSIAYDKSKTMRDDLWQVRFNELQQLKSKLIGYDHKDRLQMLLEQLMYTSEALMNQLCRGHELNTFYDVKIILNDVEHDLPLNADLYEALTDYINEDLSNYEIQSED